MKRGCLFLTLLTMITLVGCVNNNTSSFENGLVSKMESFYNHRKFKVQIDYKDSQDLYYIDGKSYHHLNNNTTVFKYEFLDNYQMYKGNELLDENYIPDVDISEEYIALLNPLKLNDYKFDILDGIYHLKYEFVTEYKIPLFDNAISSLNISLNSNEIIYNYTFEEEEKCIVRFLDSDYDINYYLHSSVDYENYYENYSLTYEELEKKLIDKESFGLILIYKTCASCARAEHLYYEFFLEYNISFFYTISTDTLNKEQKKSLNSLVSNAYDNQLEKFKNENYPNYPDSFLTPSACRIREGEFRYVLPGFISSMKELLYSLCLD